MGEYYEQILYRRNACIFALIVVFVLSVTFAVISLLIVHPPKYSEEDYYGRKNILLIIVDDLRPALRCFGDEIAITPNIDNLASSSIIFKNAYAQQALGAPSRISFLTGRRPDSLHLYDDNVYWRETIGNYITIPEHFKNHGYDTLSVGKVFPQGIASNNSDDYPSSWNHAPYWPPSQVYETEPVCPSHMQTKRNLICPVTVKNQPGGTLPDIEITNYAIQFLKNKNQKNNSAPFFLAVGYHKPHIPFRIPEEYFDLYSNVESLPNRTQFRFPKVSWNPWMDIRMMDDVKSLNLSSLYDPLPKNFQKLVRQGYYAAVSYIDDQIGRLLNALEYYNHAERTIIVLLGDNGWSLGEHQEWSKYSNFEVAVQVPLIVQIPDFTTDKKRKPFKRTSILDLIQNDIVKNKLSADYHNISYQEENLNIFYQEENPAYVSTDFVELVDLFPSLSQIANIAIPPFCNVNMTEFCCEGNSFYPIIEHMIFDPEPWIPFSWKTAAFNQYPRPSLAPANNSDKPLLKDIEIMGYSIRTSEYRYTEWVAFDNQNLKPDWPLIISRELYSHVNDSYETENLCDLDAYANTVIALSKRIKKGWQYEMPPGNDNY